MDSSLITKLRSLTGAGIVDCKKALEEANDNFDSAVEILRKKGQKVAANKQEQFEALARAIGRDDLINDVRFVERESRKVHRAALTTEIEAGLRRHSAAEWETILNTLDIPAGRVLTVPQALASPQVQQRGLLQTFDLPGFDHPVTQTRAGFKMPGAEPEISGPPPRLGEHSVEVLRSLGYSDEDISNLRSAGAI